MIQESEELVRMIKSQKRRLDISLPKDQVKWLEKKAKELHITKSQLISWLLVKKANELLELAKMKASNFTQEELERMIQIAKTPWLD